jgi:hypothetical protein
VVDKKTGALILLVVGIAILGLSLFADSIGIGGGSSAFGPRQRVGAIVGVVVIVAGLVLRLGTQFPGLHSTQDHSDSVRDH